MIATLFQLKYLRSESRLGVSLVSMANVRMKVGYNVLYETSGLLHIYGVKKTIKNVWKRRDGKFQSLSIITNIKISVFYIIVQVKMMAFRSIISLFVLP